MINLSVIQTGRMSPSQNIFMPATLVLNIKLSKCVSVILINQMDKFEPLNIHFGASKGGIGNGILQFDGLS